MGYIWLAKFTPDTLNVADGKEVHEIVVFHVVLKRPDVPDDVFLCIDRQMPRHVVFRMQHADRFRLLLNYKEWENREKGLFRIVKTFRTEWQDEASTDLLIAGTNMDKVYESFAGRISGFGTDNAADTKRIVELQEQIAQLERRVEALQKKVRTEKQYNRQLELNAEARALKREVAAMKEEVKKRIDKE